MTVKNFFKLLRNFRKSVFYSLTGNKLCQKRIERRIAKLQILLGIGSGGSVESSGEQSIVQKLKCLEQEHFCIFDAGANKGDFTKMTLDCLEGGDIRIHCFEPSKVTFDMLCNNIKSEKAVLNNKGLGKENGTFPFYTSSPGAGTASLTKRNLDYKGVDFRYAEDVIIETLDTYCDSNHINSIDLLKLDVEGHELDVLQGAAKTLKANVIKMISFEFGGCNIDTKTFLKDFYYFFKEAGFLLYRVTPSGYFYPLEDYSEKLKMFRTTNYLGIRKDLAKILAG